MKNEIELRVDRSFQQLIVEFCIHMLLMET